MPASVALDPLQGRATELDLLTACLERAASGRVQTVLIEGEAGIGKTRVLEAAVGRARGRGFHVFVGRSDEVERARPFGPLSEALGCTAGVEELRRAEIVRLLAGEDQARRPIALTRDPGAQFRIVDAFVDLVEEAALAGPVALALEDLQWADPSTIVTLRSLARRLTYVPVALLASLRPVPRAPDLEGLLDALVRDGAERIALGPLPEEVVGQLVAELVRTQPGSSLLEKVAGAAGNPLFVGELVRALVAEGAVRVVDGRAEIHDVSLPPSLRLTVLRRLSFLEDDALELLRVAASLGSIFSLRDVATVLDRSAAELLQPARKALLAGVLEERESRLAFRHALIREAIYEDLPQDARSALRLEVGRRLARSGAPALQVAEQFALGAQPGDAEAIEWLHAAAHETARSSPTLAVELLERALDLDDEDGRRAELLADLVPTLLWSGKPQEAEARAREALEAPTSPDLEQTFRLGLVAALTAQGRAKDVIDEFRNATTRTSLSADVESQLQAEAANALAFVDRLDLAEQTAHEAVAIGRPVASEGAAMGLLVLCDMARVRGRPEEALALEQEAGTLPAARRGSRLRWPPEVFRAMSLHQLDAFEDAHEALRNGQRADERLGNVSYLPVYHYEAASLLFSAGRWEDAIAQARAGLDVADEVGLEMLLPWPYGVLALIAVHRDELDGAAATLADLESRHGAETAVLSRGLLAEARGDAAGARATFARAWNSDENLGVVYRRRLLGPDLVRLALAEHDRERAYAVAAKVEEAAALARVPSLHGVALRCRGLVEGNAELLLRAVEQYKQGPRAFERALACEDAAVALARAGRIAEATARFEDALCVYVEVGARRDGARALASMRHLGIGRKRRGARKRPERGWESLTPSELEVVRLAAIGLTNPHIGQRLFISPRTVQTHLAHVFRKLDLSSRVELAAEVARRGAV